MRAVANWARSVGHAGCTAHASRGRSDRHGLRSYSQTREAMLGVGVLAGSLCATRTIGSSREGGMTVSTLRRVAIVLVACTAAGCAGRAQTLSPAHELPPESIPNDPVPGERYYILVFGSHSTPRVPRYTHTWATVVKTVEAPGCAPQVAEVHTISWMPASLDIHPWQFTPEPGRNLELHETIRMALDFGEHIAMWGPYEIHPRGYRRFLLQKAYMESGRVGYQSIDTLGEGANGSGCDCIHAVTDMDPQ